MKTRPICELAESGHAPLDEPLPFHCYCSWNDEDGVGYWWVEVDRRGIAYTGYSKYKVLPF